MTNPTAADRSKIVTPELRIEEDSPRPRNDARWIKVRCPDPHCALLVEMYVEPEFAGDAIIEALQRAHEPIHAVAP